MRLFLYVLGHIKNINKLNTYVALSISINKFESSRGRGRQKFDVVIFSSGNASFDFPYSAQQNKKNVLILYFLS